MPPSLILLVDLSSARESPRITVRRPASKRTCLAFRIGGEQSTSCPPCFSMRTQRTEHALQTQCVVRHQSASHGFCVCSESAVSNSPNASRLNGWIGDISFRTATYMLHARSNAASAKCENRMAAESALCEFMHRAVKVGKTRTSHQCSPQRRLPKSPNSPIFGSAANVGFSVLLLRPKDCFSTEDRHILAQNTQY